MAVEPRWDAAVGSVAQETARLLDALARTADESKGNAGDASGSRDAETGAATTGSSRATDFVGADSAGADEPEAETHTHVPMGSAQTCSWCPVCRGVAIVRDLSPETLRSLADVATLAAATLADLAATRGRSTPGGTGEGSPHDGGDGRKGKDGHTGPAGSSTQRSASRADRRARVVEIPVTAEASPDAPSDPDDAPHDLEARP